MLRPRRAVTDLFAAVMQKSLSMTWMPSVIPSITARSRFRASYMVFHLPFPSNVLKHDYGAVANRPGFPAEGIDAIGNNVVLVLFTMTRGKRKTFPLRR